MNCPQLASCPGTLEDTMEIATAAAERGKTPRYRHLYVQVLVAFSAGLLLGPFYPSVGA